MCCQKWHKLRARILRARLILSFVLGTYYPEWAAQLRENYMFLGKTSLLSFQTRRQLKVGACASISAQVGYTWLFLVE